MDLPKQAVLRSYGNKVLGQDDGPRGYKERSLSKIGPQDKHLLKQRGPFGKGLDRLLYEEVKDLNPEKASVVEANIYHSTNQDFNAGEELSLLDNRHGYINWEGRLRSSDLEEMIEDFGFGEIKDFTVSDDSTEILAEGSSGELKVESHAGGRMKLSYSPDNYDPETFSVAGIDLIEAEDGRYVNTYEDPEVLKAAVETVSGLDSEPEFNDRSMITGSGYYRGSKAPMAFNWR